MTKRSPYNRYNLEICCILFTVSYNLKLNRTLHIKPYHPISVVISSERFSHPSELSILNTSTSFRFDVYPLTFRYRTSIFTSTSAYDRKVKSFRSWFFVFPSPFPPRCPCEYENNLKQIFEFRNSEIFYFPNRRNLFHNSKS